MTQTITTLQEQWTKVSSFEFKRPYHGFRRHFDE